MNWHRHIQLTTILNMSQTSTNLTEGSSGRSMDASLIQLTQDAAVILTAVVLVIVWCIGSPFLAPKGIQKTVKYCGLTAIACLMIRWLKSGNQVIISWGCRSLKSVMTVAGKRIIEIGVDLYNSAKSMVTEHFCHQSTSCRRKNISD